jgi:hypothetical protein
VLGQIFYFRPQTVFVSQLFLQVIAYIMGTAWAKILPKAEKGPVWVSLCCEAYVTAWRTSC